MTRPLFLVQWCGAALLLIAGGCQGPEQYPRDNVSDPLSPNFTPDPPYLSGIMLVDDKHVVILWNNVKNDYITGYSVERKVSQAGSYMRLALFPPVGTSHSYLDTTGLKRDSVYYYRVGAVTLHGGCSYSGESSVRVVFSPPALHSIGQASDNTINLYWNQTTAFQVGYRIEQAVNGGGFSELAAVGAGVTKYTVSGLATGNSYSFRVRAYTQVSTSEYSNALKIGYLPSAVGLLRTINTPYSLKQVAISRDGAFLLWQGTNCLPLISSWSGTEVSRWNVAPFSSFAVQATDSLIAASGSVGVFRWAWSQSGDRSSMIGYSNCNLCGFSRGGSVLAGTSPSGVTLWVFPPGTQSRTLPLDSALAAAFSPDGSLVAGISRSVIRVWSVASGSPVFSIPTPGTGNSAITFAVDGGRFYSGGTDGWIRAWDGATGSAQGAWDVSAPVTSLVVRPDGMTILSSGETTGAIREWDVSDGSLIQTLEGSGSRVTCLTSGLGGRLLAAVSADAKAHLWSFGGHWWVAP